MSESRMFRWLRFVLIKDNRPAKAARLAAIDKHRANPTDAFVEMKGPLATIRIDSDRFVSRLGLFMRHGHPDKAKKLVGVINDVELAWWLYYPVRLLIAPIRVVAIVLRWVFR